MASLVQPDLVASFSTFGDFLKFLRRRAGLTQLELSIAVGYSEAQISRLEQNQRLPDLAALKALFIPALHLEREPELTTHLLALAESARQEEAPLPGIAPYKGLLFFDEPDADLFFGREALTARFVERVNALARGLPRLLAVVGASGSGKSSVMRAGLAVALKRAGWDVCVFTPTAEPIKALESILTPSLSLEGRGRKGDGHQLLIVDQFEEIFTLCRDEDARAEFVERLLAAATKPNGRTTIVLALRADFYSRCAQYPLLRQAIAQHQEYIGEMTREELRSAIEEPAKRGGWEFEPGLVELMLSDVGAGGVQDQEPGALPLLSHALLATWERRRGRMFTLAGYRAAGSVRRAIAETAESVFTDQLNQPQQDLARDIFLRLTELGEGTEDTRRRAALTELVPREEEAVRLRVVLNTLADARLVMLGEDSAEVAHEALIREWTRLREWLNENREGLRLHRHLTEQAQAWQKLNREPGELYRGARLVQALEWAKTNSGEMNPLEREFLDAAKQFAEQEEAEREAQRQRELVAAQRLAEAERRRATILRWVALGSSVLLVVMIGLALFAFSQRQEAVAQRDVAENERRIAFTRELAANAVSNLDTDPERSILLALQAVSVSSAGGKPVLIEAEEALHRAVDSSRVQFTLRSGYNSLVGGAAYSPDGTRIATTGFTVATSGSVTFTSSVNIWDAATGKELLSFPVQPWVSYYIAYSPDGKKLATASDDKTAKVWDATTGKELLTLAGHTFAVSGVVFSPDGTRIATSSGKSGTGTDHTAKIWDATTGKELLTLVGHSAGVNAIVYSPDGKRIATASDDMTAKVWDAATGKELFTMTGHTRFIRSITYSPDGKRIATGSGAADGTVKIWDSGSGQLLATLLHAATITSVVYDSTGTRLVSGGTDGKAKVWDTATNKLLFTLAGHNGGLEPLAISPDGTHLATPSDDSTIKVWDISPSGSREWLTAPLGNGNDFLSLAYSPDGTRIAFNGTDGNAKILDAQTGQVLLTLSGHTKEIKGIAFSRDGKRLATKSIDMTIKVWDAMTGRELLNIPNQFNFYNVGNYIDFSPDGQRIVSSGSKGSLKVWDAATGRELISIPALTELFVLSAARFSPDGKRIATTNIPQKFLDAETGQLLFTFGQSVYQYDLAYSVDGKRLATAGSDGIARVYDAATGRELLALAGHTSQILNLVFSPDGERLATTSSDATTKVWNVSAERQRNEQPLTLYDANNFSVAFSPDGKRLAAVGGQLPNGVLRIYALPLDDIIAIANSRATRALTNDECQKYLHVDKCP